MTLSIQLGGSISSAVVVVVLDRRQRLHSDLLAGHTAQAAPGTFSGLPGGAGALFGLVQNEAYVLAYADVAFLVSAIALLLVPLVLVVRRPPKGRALEAATA